MRFYFKLIIALLLLSGCQSTRPFVLPVTNEYGAQATSQRLLVSTDQSQPILSAVVSTRETPTPRLQVKPQEPVTALLIGRSLMLPPDTSLSKTLPLVLSGKPDPTTTIVNSVGGAVTAVGLGLVIASSIADTPQTEWGGLSNAVRVLGALLVIIIGLALLFFQGKNGRLRRLREARQAAENPLAASASEDTSKSSPTPKRIGHMSRRSKSGVALLGLGGIFFLLGLIPGSPIILLIPLAAILLLIGLVLLIAGS